jgi:uncharacterized protein
MPTLDRRTFLRGAAVAGAAAVTGPFAGLAARGAQAATSSGVGPVRPHPGYGPLVPVTDEADGVVRLLLPSGFRYRSFATAGFVMDDGVATPGRHDGMAAFSVQGSAHSSGQGHPQGTYTLIRNHEINGPVGAFGDPATAYDPMAGGGTTRLVVSREGEVIRSEVSLNGTQMNCSGGPMPWGSWITCEETVNGPDVGNDFSGGNNSLLTQKHGYIYEVPADGRGARRTEPVRAAGRFAHESVAYEKHTNALYLSEDNFAFPSGFYRYLPPNQPLKDGRLADGGRLQMLRVAGVAKADLSIHHEVGATFDVDWVDIDDPDPTFVPGTTNDQAIVAVGNQGLAQGAAIFSRLEGTIEDRGIVYFCSTQGGAPDPAAPSVPGFGDGRGQVWAYDARASLLRLVFESTALTVLDLPDNVTASPRGSLVLCEDGLDNQNFLRGLTPDGVLFDFAKNAIAGREQEEFAGSTFAPDGQTLFVNIQTAQGLSFAIRGPWSEGGF